MTRPPKGKTHYLSMRGNYEPWLLYKMAELQRFFVEPKMYKYGSTYRCHSCCSEELTKFYDLLYKDGIRQVSQEILDPMMAIGLATWFLDGGGKTGRDRKNIYFNTTKYGETGVTTVKEYFNSLGYDCEIHQGKNRSKVLLSVDASQKLLYKIVLPVLPLYLLKNRS